MKKRTSQNGGFTLVEIMIVVAIIGLLAAIAIPNFVKARTTAQATGCINNLRQFEGAKQTWALEKNKGPSDTPTEEDIKPYIKLTSDGRLPGCPGGGTYSIGPLAESPTCSLASATPPHKLP
jgi:prepilin-type N-terminal cleavage/methylation domain-containing protein